MGTTEKYVTEVETEMRLFAHRSVFTTKELKSGDRISIDNTAILSQERKSLALSQRL